MTNRTTESERHKFLDAYSGIVLLKFQCHNASKTMYNILLNVGFRLQRLFCWLVSRSVSKVLTKQYASKVVVSDFSGMRVCGLIAGPSNGFVVGVLDANIGY